MTTIAASTAAGELLSRNGAHAQADGGGGGQAAQREEN